MKKILYISPSVLPSRTANSIHVVQQCLGFSDLGFDVELIAKRSIQSRDDFERQVAATYGEMCSSLVFRTFYKTSARADNLIIALLAVLRSMSCDRQTILVSRNLYGSFLLTCLLRRRIIFETHQLEFGWRKWLQRWTMRGRKTITVVISESLRSILTEHQGLAPRETLVLHDAAPAGLQRVEVAKGRGFLSDMPLAGNIRTDVPVCGYFGHLYPGRGIEIVAAMAEKRPDVQFVVFGGNDPDIDACRSRFQSSNLYFAGYVPHPVAQKAMSSCDVLLMPYQKSVSIGVAGHDTARWMSPMKMFEYLATGNPIISSDLPVLREVLFDGKNAFLAPPDDPDRWIEKLDILLSDGALAARIGAKGREAYLETHNWTARARSLVQAWKEA